jgi:hypothetical protein
MWIAYQVDVPPGAVIATLGGATFAAVALVRRYRMAPRPT